MVNLADEQVQVLDKNGTVAINEVDYPAVFQGEGGDMSLADIDLKIRNEIREYLAKQGYEVSEEARLTGKSGIEHSFDMLARRDDGFISYTVAICVMNNVGKESEVTNIFNFANKAYDTGIIDRLLIAVPGISQEAKILARKQRIKVIEGERIEALLAAMPETATGVREPLKFATREELVQSLRNLGYRVEAKAAIQSRSGVEYTFDILAFVDMDGVGHRLGVDFLGAEKEVSLEQVSLFDTKAYEVGLDDKVIIVSPTLSQGARQFAEHHGIRVFELGARPSGDTQLSPNLPVPPVEKPSKKASRAEGKQLRQMVEPEAIQLIPEVMARRYNAIPVSISGNTLKVAMADPTDIFALEAFAAQSKKRIQPVAANPREVREAVDFNYKGSSALKEQLSQISIPLDAVDETMAIDAAVDAPLAQALNLIIEEAVRAHASDVHIEPEEDRVRVRYRIDGTLQDMMSLPITIHRAIISRIKILADMNIADHMRPQDGQFSTQAKGRDIDVRVATAPTVCGEMSVLRLLDKSRATLGLAELGFLPDSLAKFENMLKVPYGMILVSGPTGAGKTTTLSWG